MYRLLIVDDEELIVRNLSGYLSAQFEDLELHRAYSAYEAIDAMRKIRFDIVISDISMPAMDGIELLDFIKRYWPDCRVIIVTAYNEFKYAYNTLKYDQVNFILKVEGYEVIRNTVEQYIRQLDNDQKKEQFFLNLGNRISRMTPYLRSDALDRLVNGDTKLQQEELDMLEIPLVMSNSLLLTIGLLSDMNASEIKKRLSEISEYLEKKIRMRKIEVVFHTYESYAVWFFQKTTAIEDQPYEDVASYIQEAFSELPDLLMKQTGESLSLVIGKSFFEWCELHSVFQNSIVYLERMRGESGAQLVNVLNEEHSHYDDRSYPGIEELNILWNMLKSERKEQFQETLKTKLAFMHKINDIDSALPLTAVSAMEWLLFEAVRYYALDPAVIKIEYRQINRKKGLTGSAWLNMCLDLFDKVLENRTLMKKNRFTNLITQMNTFIEAHYTEDISLTQIAEMLHYNPSYLSRVYKEQTGKALMNYINELRIYQAKKMLQESAIKISEVAHRIGFNSTKYFNQVFKKTVGISASTYREEQMK